MAITPARVRPCDRSEVEIVWRSTHAATFPLAAPFTRCACRFPANGASSRRNAAVTKIFHGTCGFRLRHFNNNGARSSVRIPMALGNIGSTPFESRLSMFLLTGKPNSVSRYSSQVKVYNLPQIA